MTTDKIKILFILPSLAAGGAERILSFVAQEIDRTLFDTTLLVTGYEKDTVYTLKDLNVVYLNKPRVLKSIFSITNYLKQHKPNIVVTSIVHLNTMAALISVRFPKIKFVAREANVLSTLSKYNPYTKSIFPKFLVKTAYKLVDTIICQSKDMQDDLITNYGVLKSKTVLINNPITQYHPLKKVNRIDDNSLKLITVARLSKEKGHDRLLRALSNISFKFSYTIIGDGIEKSTILNLVKQYQLEDHVRFIKYTDNVSDFLSESDLFLQGSYVEGFPNVLLESCIVGTPILAFNAPGGLNEIIEHGENGFIADGIEEFIDYLNDLYSEFIFKPESVSQVVKDRFDKMVIIEKYENLFKAFME